MRLSPAELSYLHTSLTSSPPLRPDLRSLTQYRPYSILTDFLATANGSARVTWGTGKEGGDVLVVVKAQVDNTVQVSQGVYGGQVSVDVYLPPSTQTEYRDGDEDGTAFLVESLSSLLRSRQGSSYGIDPRNLLITDTKAWHIWIDCVILSSDIPQPLDALSLAIRVALQTSLIPHLTLEEVPLDRTYEERASIMDIQKGREPHDERLFQVDDDWDNAVPLIPKKDWWKLPVFVTANVVDETIFFDASPSEILVTTARYAIASAPLNSVSERRKVVLCESVGSAEGYSAGRGINLVEFQKMVQMALQVGKEIMESGDTEVEGLQKA